MSSRCAVVPFLHPILFLILVAAIALLAASPSRAGDEDWWEGFAPWGVEGRVYTAVVHAGDLFVAGDFQWAGGQPCNNVARWDGVRWRPVDGGVDGLVNVLLSTETALLAGGHFTTAGGDPALRAARYEGGAWTQLGDGFDAAVQTLLMKDATLVAGGHFEQSGAVVTGRVAAYDGVGWSAYPAADDLAEGVVYALHAFDAALWAGGWWMYDAAWRPLNCLAVNAGDAWARPGGTAGPDEIVQCMYDRDGTLYLGGDFENVDGLPSAHFAFWTPGVGFHPVTGLPGSAYAITDHFGLLVVGHDGGVTPYDPVHGWRESLGLQSVRALASYGMALVAGGIFSLTGVAEEGVALREGDDWVRLGGGLTAPGASPDLNRVNALCAYEGDVVAGGSFNVYRLTAGVPPCANVGRWDGRCWRPLGAGLAGEVRAVAVYDGTLVAAGDFTWAGDEAAAHVAWWDGEVWRQLGGGIPDTWGTVEALTVHDGRLYAGGWFRATQGAPADHVAVWDGEAWSALPAQVNGRVNALASFGGDLVAGGYFTTAGGWPIANIARWDGAQWSALGDGVDGGVLALGADPHGPSLVASGYFANAGGAPANRIARWDGAAWTALGDGLDDAASAIVGLATHLYVGGAFTAAGGAPASGIARWTGSGWETLGSGLGGGMGTTPRAAALLVHDRRLYLGGDFATAGGKPSVDMALWTEDVVAVEDVIDLPRRTGPALHAWPNPFNPLTRIAVDLPAGGDVELCVYDLRGRRVRTLAAGAWSAGRRELAWDGRDDRGRDLPSGAYLVRVRAAGRAAAATVTLVR